MKAIILALTATVLAGCSAIGSILETANGGVAGLFVTQATVRYIEKADGEAGRYERAQRVKEAAAEIRKAAAADAVTVASLRDLALSKIPAEYDISDKLLAAELITFVAAELEQKLGDGVILEADLPNLDALLRRIEFAAAYFPAP